MLIQISVIMNHVLCWLNVLLFAYEIFVKGAELSAKQELASKAVKILTILLKYLLHHRQKAIVKMLIHISKEYDKITDKQRKYRSNWKII
ncbi:hypothetical protein HNY73_016207 [Argiope bruennichi]|uniref:Uncharacterized protein n=1 Tax=Argiope bruennichi TaxID=94029 RepID=A0A8T0EI36_ARGBR|nr:hypothetical protein HNY73_016207 [Argiope bruennichi]